MKVVYSVQICANFVQMAYLRCNTI